jgi:hypothetical protein
VNWIFGNIRGNDRGFANTFVPGQHPTVFWERIVPELGRVIELLGGISPEHQRLALAFEQQKAQFFGSGH